MPRSIEPEESTLRLHALFSDHAVIQREMAVPIIGWDAPGTPVVVSFGGQTKRARAGADGKWRIMLEPMPAGGPHQLHVEGTGALIRSDIFVGEVWLASGQSNMQAQMHLTDEMEEGYASTIGQERIRLFTVPHTPSIDPRRDVEDAVWRVPSASELTNFSAVAWWFALKVQNEIDLPIGIIDSCWGGTVVTSWSRRESLQEIPQARDLLDYFDGEYNDYLRALDQYRRDRDEWRSRAMVTDPGNEGELFGWHLPTQYGDNWREMELPTYWHAAGLEINGAVWFRREVDVPAAWEGRNLHLHLGAIDDFDVTYFNGERVGETDRNTPGFWAHPREYVVPGRLVRAGRNVIAVRVFDVFAAGGFAGDPEQMRLFPHDDIEGEPAIQIDGTWLYKVEFGVEHYREPSPALPQPPTPSMMPGWLYNGMIHPLIEFPIRGVLWYQGESDTANPWLYSFTFPAMVKDWRGMWGLGDFPCYYVQIAPWMANTTGIPAWAYMREVQLNASKTIPNSGMVVITDHGDYEDVHPRRKRPVGERLARFALRHDYHRDIVAWGPVYGLHRAEEGGRLRVFFDHSADGLKSDGQTLSGFEISGVNQIFHPAEAVIDGDSIVLHSDAVPHPVAIRFGWANYPRVNLFNSEGLPASPFRTDNW